MRVSGHVQVRQGEVMAALQHARSHLGPYHKDSGATLLQRRLLRDTLALLAYPEPEHSPMAHLLKEGQRNATVDAVNSAMLHFARQGAMLGVITAKSRWSLMCMVVSQPFRRMHAHFQQHGASCTAAQTALRTYQF
jgi:hypothetical protein